MSNEGLNIPDGHKLVTPEQKQAIRDAIEILKKSVADMNDRERRATLMMMMDWVAGTLIVTNCNKNAAFASEAAELHNTHVRRYIAIAWLNGLLEFPQLEEPT